MSISAKSEARDDPFSNLWKIFQTWSPLAPLMEEIDICEYWSSCRKFHSQQLLFKAFFDIIDIFGTVEPYSEFTFPFQYIIIFQTY